MNGVIRDPDFLALGLGGTNMMAMLWTVALGRTAVGVEMRGDPFLGVHWNIRADFYHQLGLIDQMMLERYGEARLPRRGDGRLFRLAECFYSPILPLEISSPMRSSMALTRTSILWEPFTMSNLLMTAGAMACPTASLRC
ncbi:hypothetical protein [Ktedonobacter sp. SOSP1-85]|uniref:hypothetical protein n=1 Tax=Ktedonobacter sp. SOSP1-85 TaxID=2778367 RepID=UPI001915ACCC|nr:hypothetical protein [Ktedonobacter sp. SOSP1-85]